jgi:hypothetical protein
MLHTNPSIAEELVKRFSDARSPLYPQYLTACLEEAIKLQLHREAVELYMFLLNLELQDQAAVERTVVKAKADNTVTVKPVKPDARDNRSNLMDELIKALVGHIATLHRLEKAMTAHVAATAAAAAAFADVKAAFAAGAVAGLTAPIPLGDGTFFVVPADSKELKEFVARVEAMKSEGELLGVLGEGHVVNEAAKNAERAYLSKQPKPQGRTKEETDELELKQKVEAKQHARQEVFERRARLVADVNISNVVFPHLQEKNAARHEYRAEERHLSERVRTLLQAQSLLQEQMANLKESSSSEDQARYQRLVSRYAKLEQDLGLALQKLDTLRSKPTPVGVSHEAIIRAASAAAGVSVFIANAREANNQSTELEVMGQAIRGQYITEIMSARSQCVQLNTLAQGAVPEELVRSLQQAVNRAETLVGVPIQTSPEDTTTSTPRHRF